MKLPDVNFWLALLLTKHPHHDLAALWMEGELDRAGLFFCRATQQSLVRLLTTAAVLSPYGIPPLTNREAWEKYAELCEDDRIIFAQEPAGIEATWKILATPETPSPKVWMDAYLAAFAINGGMRLVTLDRDFKRFEPNGLDLCLLTR
jgi:toxin-antitoxin system PIN domain toxin